MDAQKRSVIKSLLSGPLPGDLAQNKMGHPVRGKVIKDLSNQNPKIAGVLIALYWEKEVLNTILIERTSHNTQDKHRGQIGFPGGKQEDEDRDIVHTALREAQEEVGLPDHDVEVLGRLSSLFVPVSNFLIHPVVGYVHSMPDLVRQASEVATIIRTPLASFTNSYVGEVATYSGMKFADVPYYLVEDFQVWGATAMVISEMMALFSGLDWD